MRWDELALALGLGGAVGAAAAVSVAGSRLLSSFKTLSAVMRPYLASRSDPGSETAREAFEEFADRMAAMEASLGRLGRALKSKRP